jgi:hypothetical protein
VPGTPVYGDDAVEALHHADAHRRSACGDRRIGQGFERGHVAAVRQGRDELVHQVVGAGVNVIVTSVKPSDDKSDDNSVRVLVRARSMTWGSAAAAARSFVSASE